MDKKPAGGEPAQMPPMRPGHGGPMGGRMNAEKPKNTKKTLGRLLKYIGANKIVLIALLLIMLMTTGADLLGPLFQQKAIDTFTVVDGKIRVDFDSLKTDLAVMAVVFAFSAALSYFSGILSAKLSQATVYTMRNDLFRKIVHLPVKYIDTHKHGDVMSRMTNDVENVSNAVSSSISSLFSAVITLIGALVMMLRYSWKMTIVSLVTIPITIFVTTALAKFMRKHFIAQQRLLGQMNGQVEENVTSYKTVVAYGKEPQAVAAFTGVSEGLCKTAVKAKVWGSVMGPIMNFIGNFQYVLLAIVGGFMVINGKGGMTPGKIQAMLQYSKKFTFPINMIANQYSSVLTALAGAERIFEIMDTADEINEGKEPVDVAALRGDVSFRDVTFGYKPEKTVLKNLNLDIKAGQKIAIVGATGSGKTTVVNLLTRFYEIGEGEITIDGQDIRTWPKQDLRRAIAIVLQDTVLFRDTIRNNIKYGRDDAADEDVHRAAAGAHAADFIERLPEGYETVLAEAGSNLSQGQRQLLSISRAILADPKILILDEATSSVDTRTEMHIQKAMVELMKGRTSLIIAHRLSTIRDADRIVVIKDGRVFESGSHDELLALGGEYAKLYNNQFAGIAT